MSELRTRTHLYRNHEPDDTFPLQFGSFALQRQPDSIGARNHSEAITAVEKWWAWAFRFTSFSCGAVELLQHPNKQPGGDSAGVATTQGGDGAGYDGAVSIDVEHNQVRQNRDM